MKNIKQKISLTETTNINNEYKTIELLKRLLCVYVRPYSKKVSLAVFFMIASGLCSANIVKLVQPTIDQIFLTHNRHMLFWMPFFIFLTFAVKGITEYFQLYIIRFVGQSILTDLQIQMYEHLLLADIEFIHTQSSGRLISSFANDISMMRASVSHLLIGCAKHFVTVLFLIILMFMLEPSLSCIVFLVFPIAIYPIQKFGTKIRNISAKTQEELGHYTSKLDETFQSIKIVKSFLGEKIETTRAKNITDNILKYYKKIAKLDALVSPTMEILSGLAVGGILCYGGFLVINGQTTPGALFAFIMAFVSTYRPFKSLVSLNVNLQEGLAAARRVFFILDIRPKIRDNKNAQDIDITGKSIEFKNVELQFNQKKALVHLNLMLQYGKTVAFVGGSGSGKTSVSNLLVRFYNTTDGSIKIGDHDINDIKISSLRKQISLVTQDTLLFDTTIAENISYGMPDATEEEIITAAKFADAHEFIMQLPKAYDTMIGTQGFTLSGGQRQRISIARAMLKDAPILICDEATSSLDQVSERTILQSIRKFRQNKTNLVITHRLTSITEVDHIVVMKSGKIFEEGTHLELMNNKSEYYRLYTKEMSDS